jgi:chemotaxis protein MotB
MAASQGSKPKALCLALVVGAGLTGGALAQESAPPGDPPTADYEEINALLASIQTRVDEMNASAKDADAAMAFLSDQVEAAIRKLSVRETENTTLRETALGLSDELETVALTRDQLGSQVARLTREKDALFERLEGQVRELASLLSLEREVTTNLRASLDERASELRASLGEREQLSADLSALQGAQADARAASEAQARRLAAVSARLETSQASLEETRARNRALDGALAAAKARGATLERELGALREGREGLDSRLAAVSAARDDARARNRTLEGEIGAADARLATLNRQLAELRRQIAELGSLLESSESRNEKQKEAIADLGRRLNLALATKVRELARYRSEFFGRLREVLGERPDVRILGDRFVFQSEVLFPTGEAEIEEEGRGQLMRLAESLKEIGATIPPDIDWVLRIDGHTDERPIQTPRFPSNWELSTARAISVARFLIEQGVPADRVMAAGFAEFRPLDPGRDEAAFRRNRRIEFRLTQK